MITAERFAQGMTGREYVDQMSSNKERMLRDANVLLLAGSALTAVGIGCSIFLVSDIVFGSTVAIAASQNGSNSMFGRTCIAAPANVPLAAYSHMRRVAWARMNSTTVATKSTVASESDICVDA